MKNKKEENLSAARKSQGSCEKRSECGGRPGAAVTSAGPYHI